MSNNRNQNRNQPQQQAPKAAAPSEQAKAAAEQLATAQKRMDELLGKDTLTEDEQKELAALEVVHAEAEKVAAEEAAKAAPAPAKHTGKPQYYVAVDGFSHEATRKERPEGYAKGDKFVSSANFDAALKHGVLRLMNEEELVAFKKAQGAA